MNASGSLTLHTILAALLLSGCVTPMVKSASPAGCLGECDEAHAACLTQAQNIDDKILCATGKSDCRSNCMQ